MCIRDSRYRERPHMTAREMLMKELSRMVMAKKNLAKGVRVQMEDEKVTVDLSILMSYGHTIPEVGRAVQDGVKNAVESMTGLEIAAVNVNVGGITFPPAAKA